MDHNKKMGIPYFKGGKYSWMLSSKTANQMIPTLNATPVCDSEQILSDIRMARKSRMKLLFGFMQCFSIRAM